MRRLYLAVFLFILAAIGTFYLITQRLNMARYFPPATTKLPNNSFYDLTPRPAVSITPHGGGVPLVTATPYVRVPLRSHVYRNNRQLRAAPTPLGMPTMQLVTPMPVPSFVAITPAPVPHTPPPIAVPTYGPVIATPAATAAPTASP